MVCVLRNCPSSVLCNVQDLIYINNLLLSIRLRRNYGSWD